MKKLMGTLLVFVLCLGFTTQAQQAEDSVWVVSGFYFSVQFGDNEPAKFQEVSGLEIETQPVDYEGDVSPEEYGKHLPGISMGNVTLKNGIFLGKSEFDDWYSKAYVGNIEPTTVVIMLLDQMGEAAMTWTLFNAWPAKIEMTDLKADRDEVAVEIVELAYERMEIGMP